MYYPSIQDVQIAIKKLNIRHRINITVINEGQLKFALEKPRMKIYGHEQYPELYQKAAVLMEGLTKIHALSDGNKRCAMLIAGFMVKANGAELVLPLKTIRLSVDTAVDAKDEMTEEIQQWFKVHIASNIDQLSILLTENVEEKTIIKNLLEQKKHSEAEGLLDKWMVFDSYPEHRVTWKKLDERWKSKDLARQKSDQSDEFAIPEIPENINDYNSMHSSYNSEHIRKISDLEIVNHTLEELVQYARSIKQFEELLTNTKDVHLLASQAHMLNQSKKFIEAIEIQQKILQIDPTQHSAYLHIGRLYRYNQDYQKSIESFRKCIEINSADPRAHLGIAITLMRMNRNKEALKEINKSIETKPARSLPHYIKSIIQVMLKDFDSAEKSIRQALKRQPTNPEYLAALGRILSEIGKYDEAAEACRKAIDTEPESMAYVHSMGYVYNAMKNYDEVIRFYNVVLQKKPDDLETLFYIGGAYYNKKKYKKALQYLKKGLTINPKDKIGLRLMAITLVQMGEYDKAIKYLDQYIELERDDMQLVIIKSVILVEQNKIDDALELIEKIVKNDPDAKKAIRNDQGFSAIRNFDSFKKLTE